MYPKKSRKYSKSQNWALLVDNLETVPKDHLWAPKRALTPARSNFKPSTNPLLANSSNPNTGQQYETSSPQDFSNNNQKIIQHPTDPPWPPQEYVKNERKPQAIKMTTSRLCFQESPLLNKLFTRCVIKTKGSCKVHLHPIIIRVRRMCRSTNSPR